MASPYPGRIPERTNTGSADSLLKDPLAYTHWTALVEDVQAIMDTAGVNPQSDKGSVDNRLDLLESQIAAFGATGVRNLVITNDATTPTTKFVVTAELIGIEGILVSSVSVTCDITVSGKNGITFTRAVNTWGHIWLGVNANLTAAVIFDVSDVRGSINLSSGTLAGYTHWRWIGAWRLNGTGSGNLCIGNQIDAIFWYGEEKTTAPTSILNGQAGVSAFGTATALSAAIPPRVRYVSVFASMFSGTAALNGLSVRPAGSTSTTGTYLLTTSNGITTGNLAHLVCDTSANRAFQWKLDNTTGSPTVTIEVIGFLVPL